MKPQNLNLAPRRPCFSWYHKFLFQVFLSGTYLPHRYEEPCRLVREVVSLEKVLPPQGIESSTDLFQKPLLTIRKPTPNHSVLPSAKTTATVVCYYRRHVYLVHLRPPGGALKSYNGFITIVMIPIVKLQIFTRIIQFTE